ncbi:MAG TPA: DsbA family oxidoreductase [Membranihabitans sp.]|nr:DsbA family oxidoreductase [Membranihabitans sp.]
MTITIWSDIRCPFCYIGKHKFEAALEKFPHKDEIKVEWKSFELDPGLKTDPNVSTLDYLARIKGLDRSQVEEMTQYTFQAGNAVGLELNIEKSILSNSFQAHRLIQFAKTKGMANEVEEALFKAHFTDGLDVDDIEVLVRIGQDAGLEADEVREVLQSKKFVEEVQRDQAEARAMGIRGVPFFIFNDKYGLSGAQPVETFLGALQQSYEEYSKSKQPIMFEEGPSCSADGDCL